jgi:hypothetical protein
MGRRSGEAFRGQRRTVYHWIQTAQLDRDRDEQAVSYKPRPPVASLVDSWDGRCACASGHGGNQCS